MRGGGGDEVGEAFEGGAVAVMQIFRHGLGEGQEFGHRRPSSIENARFYGWITIFRGRLMSAFS